ncbi:unnamed protein product [Pieris brassicae]|uniref:Protein arginine N-methyltransferase domain-containing protein n=1 Tax=Pieris brassicae TaxID=7116 RepID=A0A9P0SHE3_PIEBR|nr:unnamed protein product [Pieris brassicae]
MANIEDINARQYIEYARQLTINESYTKAFDMYLIAFEKFPALKELYEDEFRLVINKLNDVLVCADKIHDIFSNFSRAISLFSGNVYLLNELGKYLYKFGYYSDAWLQFHRALKVDAGFVNAEKNLNSVKNLLVERWHFRMLNDVIRNDTYRAAIHDVIRPTEDSILDIGCGTGLLSLYANECNPKTIAACDSSEVMANIANTVFNDNALDQLIILNKNSTVLHDTDIGGKCSVLITELFDAGLFGEHILTTLHHAWKNLLFENAKVLPSSAEFFVIGVQCNELINKYQLCKATKDILNVPFLNTHILLNDESYDCEDIQSYKTLKYITEPKSVTTIDFNDINNIEDKLNNSEPTIVQMTVTQDGEVNSFIGWFNLNLTQKYKLSTDPQSPTRAKAWQNAIFFDKIPQRVKKDERFVCKFSSQSGKMTLLPESNKMITRVSPEVIRFLNDLEYLKKITSCLGLACVYLGQMTEMSDMSIVDLCPFPFFGMQMLKRGIKSIVCCAKTEFDKSFMDEVFKANDIDLSKISYLIGDSWNQDSFGVEKYHAVFCNMLEVGGDIDLRYKDVGLYLKQTRLLPGGLFLPTKISLIAQIAQCDSLDTNNRLYDKNISDFKIAQHLNRYQASQNFCLDYSLLDFIPLSAPTDLGGCMNMASDVINVAIKKTENANCILCWYNIELMESLGEISTKRPNCFIDGTAFLADPHIFMRQGDIANILHCVDSDGSFKLMLDVEAT